MSRLISKKLKKTVQKPHAVGETIEALSPISSGWAFTYQQLKDVLFWCWDGFERAGMLFFLVGTTARQVLKNEPLSGDKLEIGVRKLEWVSGGKNILDVFLSPYFVKEDDKQAEYKYQDIPIIIHIYEDSPYVTSVDRIVYDYEVFCVPNPFDKFVAEYE